MDDRAEVVLETTSPGEVAAALQQLGFRLALVVPADAPELLVIEGFGLRVRVQRADRERPIALRLQRANATAQTVTLPGGSTVAIETPTTLALPPSQPTLQVVHAGPETRWSAGRAGMGYRDLLPDRHGGRFIVSHIRLEHGGDVPDWVHFHRIAAQLIYCRAGWVRVVYEDQGPAFVMHPGDCVLQPPGIRHRVLAAAAGTEVVELGSPAVHETHADPSMTLPNRGLADPARRFEGQRFLFDVAAQARWRAHGALQIRELGLAAASAGAIAGRVVRMDRATATLAHAGDLRFGFVLEGRAMLTGPDGPAIALARDDAFALPRGRAFELASEGPLTWLELSAGAVATQPAT